MQTSRDETPIPAIIARGTVSSARSDSELVGFTIDETSVGAPLVGLGLGLVLGDRVSR